DGIRDFHVTGVQTCALPISAQLSVNPSNVHANSRQPRLAAPPPALPRFPAFLCTAAIHRHRAFAPFWRASGQYEPRRSLIERGARAGLHWTLISPWRSEEHTSELQSRENLVCRLLLEK